MDDATKRIVEGLARAIQAEVEGQHFYLMAARSTSDEQGREVFEQLAAEEADHARFLRAQHEALATWGELDRDAVLGPQLDLSDPSPIFSESLRERAKDAHFEMSALSIGIQLEESAVRYYRSQAEAAGEPQVEAFYLQLADWEAGHHQILLRQQEYLKEDYWADSGFSPF